MNKFMLTAMAVTATVVMTGAVSAQATEMETYAGVGAGVFKLKYNDPLISFNSNQFGGFVYAGVKPSEYFAAELRVGSASNGTALVPGTAVSVKMGPDYFLSYLAKPMIPVTSDFNVYGLLGGTTMKVTATASNGAVSASASKTKTDLSYGVGFDYAVSEQVKIGMEWASYWNKVNLDAVSQASLEGWTATVGYSF